MKALIKWLPWALLSMTALLTVIISHEPPRVADSKLELEAIQQAIEHAPVPMLDLSPIKAEVAELATLIKHMQREDEASFNTLVSNIKTELQTKLDTMHTTITSLENKQHPVSILPETRLPFTVISIDSLQHVSVATVTYDYKTTALEAGDSLAGWQVVAVNFAKQEMVFKNDDGEVHVNLNAEVAHA